jgi:uncharacterized membrane protein YedE/YeeE
MEIWQPLAGGVLIGLASFVLYIGIGRFSIRSLVATLVFMAAGIATVLLVRIIELGEVVGKI